MQLQLKVQILPKTQQTRELGAFYKKKTSFTIELTSSSDQTTPICLYRLSKNASVYKWVIWPLDRTQF